MGPHSLHERIRKELGSVNPAYIENILAMNHAQFGEWLVSSISGLGLYGASELAEHLAMLDQCDIETIQFGMRTITKQLKIYLFVMKEREAQLNAISNPG